MWHLRFVLIRYFRFRYLSPTVFRVVDAQIDLFAVGCSVSQHHPVCGGQLNQLDVFSCHSVNVHPFPVAMAFSASVSSDTPGLPVSVIALAEVIVGRLLKNATIAAWLREQSLSEMAYPAQPVTVLSRAIAVRA